MDHESDTEEVQAHHGENQILETTNKMYGNREYHTPEAGADTVDVAHVAGISHREIVNSLEIVDECRVPKTTQRLIYAWKGGTKNLTY